jgi:hypothetical protein
VRGKRKDASRLVRKHLHEVSRALLEGENKEKFAAFLKEHERQGLYALYKKNGELYYVGRASDLLHRLSAHRSDLHGKRWDKLAIYIVNEKLKLHDVESLLIGVSKPEGNKNRGKLKNDNQEPKQSKKNRRITENKIVNFIDKKGVAKTAAILGISPGRVSQLRGDKRLRRWIIAAGKREKILIAIERTKA